MVFSVRPSTKIIISRHSFFKSYPLFCFVILAFNSFSQVRRRHRAPKNNFRCYVDFPVRPSAKIDKSVGDNKERHATK